MGENWGKDEERGGGEATGALPRCEERVRVTPFTEAAPIHWGWLQRSLLLHAQLLTTIVSTLAQCLPLVLQTLVDGHFKQ